MIVEPKILVVDDEPGVRDALQAILTDEGFRVRCAGSGEEGLEALDSEAFDAVLLDVWLPGIDGLETLSHIRERYADIEVVMISGHGNIDTAVRATKLGAFDFVEKPLSLEKTLLVLRNALRQRRLESVNRQLMAQLARDTEILGESRRAQRLRLAVEEASLTLAPVLITGRPGLGRERIARRIHGSGEAAGRPFVHVPFGALDEAAAREALFGTDESPGRIALAAGGTLYLEDLDRVSTALQQRLASALSAPSDTTLLQRAMVSVDPGGPGLDEALRNQVDVVRIDVPSLRERPQDIPVMAERFMRELAREYGREAKRLGPEALTALKAYDWPGEIQELRNLMERLLLSTPGDAVRVDELPVGSPSASRSDPYGVFPSLADGLQVFERYYVGRILGEENDDIARTADRLGLSEPALRA
jgi:two-component system nitrogen regulation response regulator NtrX